MIPIYNRQGRVVAWVNSNYIYHLSGRQVIAFLNNNYIFTNRGRHLGRLSGGFFRDKRGHAVAFLQGATNGPIPPIPSIPPIPPIPIIASIPPIYPIPPVPPIDSLSWSSLTWDDFVGQ